MNRDVKQKERFGTGPDCIVVGAGKSGTTSLYRYLAQHRQIFMAPIKEPRFFSLNCEGRYPDLGSDAPKDLVTNYERNSVSSWSEYCDLFKEAHPRQQKGEVSPQYLFTERSPSKIYEYVPDVKLVAVLRHPVEIAYSAFKMNIRNGYETECNFELAVPLDNSVSRVNWRWKLYIEQALHGRNLGRFYSVFPAAQVVAVLYDDLVKSPEKVMLTICRHLGLEDDFQFDFKERLNVGYEPRLDVKTRKVIKNITPSFIRNQYRTSLNALVRKRVSIPLHLYRKYLPVFRTDIQQLQTLLGKDLSSWL